MRRLTFAYRDGTIELVSDQRVDMRVPARTVSDEAEPRAAFWYELRDAGSEVLFRLAAEDPIPTSVEVFSDDPERTVERVDHVPEEAMFTVLLPEVEAAEEVRLLRTAPLGDRADAFAEGEAETVEVGRFRLAGEG